MTSSDLTFKGKGDAYIEWAEHTNYRYIELNQKIGLITQSSSASGNEGPINIEIKTLGDNKSLKDNLDPDAYSRFELSAPIKTGALPDSFPNGLPRGKNLVLGVIDDGFPFLNAPYKSRTLALWLQANDGDGSVRTGVDFATESIPNEEAYAKLGLNNLRRRATHGAHVLDLFAGPMPARSRVSPSRMTQEGEDGSAHLPPTWEQPDDLASTAPLVLVQPPSQAINDPTGRWLGHHVLLGVDFIIETAGAFKRFPKTEIAAHTPLELKQTLSEANPQTNDQAETANFAFSLVPEQKVVINVSWGPQTGPHDGSSLLEMALVQRVDAAKAKGQEVTIVLPVGNSFGARAHAQFRAKEGCNTLEWHVMPDADHPQFLEVWWPARIGDKAAKITVTAPDQSELSNENNSAGSTGVWGSANSPWHIVVVPYASRPMALVALAPTRASLPPEPGDAARAPHGCWKIKIGKVDDSEDDVHVYVARNTANMGGRRRSKDSYLHDPKYEDQRQNQAPHRPAPDDSIVRRSGTLNGIATAPEGQGCVVVGGYVLNKARKSGSPTLEGRAAPYASSGPGVSGGRAAPDVSLPTDESPDLRGVRGGAVREGTSIRLIGTSTAAPQLARKIANGKWPPTREEQVGKPAQPSELSPDTDPRLGHEQLPMSHSPNS